MEAPKAVEGGVVGCVRVEVGRCVGEVEWRQGRVGSHGVLVSASRPVASAGGMSSLC